MGDRVGQSHGESLTDAEWRALEIGAACDSGLPVPLAGGDRQLSGSHLAHYIVERIEVGDLAHARLLLHLAGAEWSLGEVPFILQQLREAGQDAAAEAVLHHAGGRVIDDVLRIVKLLIEAQQYGDAELVLQIALPE